MASKLTRQIIAISPKSLVLFQINEHGSKVIKSTRLQGISFIMCLSEKMSHGAALCGSTISMWKVSYRAVGFWTRANRARLLLKASPYPSASALNYYSKINKDFLAV